ncbi:hypothetical protein THUN1379_06790 [Paludibacterium sp. THUN1379]|uniref:hypothetical protein n=1 Tax=Paludibacterium sp. THUN1379 TaxID=3112107 RepID=UPI00308CFE41|nr:hypothetical protein THUN1379_06790 [Paludibacterium sp. THUN1379]
MEAADNFIIRPGTSYSPNSRYFIGMNKIELKDFYQWFMASLPYCIEELMQLVMNVNGFENWNADDSPESLDVLGSWFVTQVAKRDFNPQELSSIEDSVGKSVDFSKWELTEKTKSLAFYVGMYYGEVAVKNRLGAKWGQSVSNKSNADYGQPIISGEGILPINPVRVAHSIACRVVDGNADGTSLRKAYDYWAGLSTKK